MTKELQEYYEAQFDLFSKPGWREFIEQATELRNAYNQVERIKDSNDLWFMKGRLDILDWLLHWEEQVNKSYKDLTNE